MSQQKVVNFRLVVGSHNKVGTNFLLKVVRDLALATGLTVWEPGCDVGFNCSQASEEWNIYFDHWSKWRMDLDTISFSGIHAFRHPVRQILSATRYHLKSKESWLHEPRGEFDGKSYQEFLLSLPTFEDQVLFEMNHSSKSTIQEMFAMLDDERFFHLDIESVSRDPEMKELRKCYKFAGISGILDVDAWLKLCRKHCLWNMEKPPSHSTLGIAEGLDEAKSKFNEKMRENFRQIHGNKTYFLCFA